MILHNKKSTLFQKVKKNQGAFTSKAAKLKAFPLPASIWLYIMCGL